MKKARRYFAVSLFLALGFFLTSFLLLHFRIWVVPEGPYAKVDAGVFYGALLTLTLWGIFLLYRMQNERFSKLFFWILVLTQIWLYSGFLKRFCDWDGPADVALWLFSYGPMLFLPGIWLCLVLSDFTHWRIPRILFGLDLIALFLFVLILLNPLHHWAFLPVVDEQGTIVSWQHGPLYFVVSSYILFLVFLSFLILIGGTIHKRNTGLEAALLLIPLGLMLVYSILYYLNVRFIRKTPVLNNYYVMFAFLSFLLMEAGLRGGLIQNSGFYRSYFTKGPYRLALADSSYALFARNDGFTFAKEIRDKEEAVVGDFRYRKKPIEGGYLILQEDITDVLRLQRELLSKQQELKQTTSYLEKRQRVEKEIEGALAKEKLSESVFAEIRLESVEIERLVSALPDTLSPENRPASKGVLEELQTRLAFLKQRCLFLVNATLTSGLSYEDFVLSQGSLNRDLANVGFTVGLSYPAFQTLALEDALKVNAFLRSIIQAFGASRGAVLLSLDPVSGALKARLSPEGPLQQDRFRFSPKIREEDGEYFLSLEGRA